MAPDFLPEKPGPSSPRPRVPGTPWEQVLLDPSCSLTLEWNNLGAWEDAFATFCRALAGNLTLRQLDLRNNQISHQGAEELALALKGNTSLQQLGEARRLAPSPSRHFPCPVPGAEGWGQEARGATLGACLWVMPQRKRPGQADSPGNKVSSQTCAGITSASWAAGPW